MGINAWTAHTRLTDHFCWCGILWRNCQESENGAGNKRKLQNVTEYALILDLVSNSFFAFYKNQISEGLSLKFSPNVTHISTQTDFSEHELSTPNANQTEPTLPLTPTNCRESWPRRRPVPPTHRFRPNGWRVPPCLIRFLVLRGMRFLATPLLGMGELGRLYRPTTLPCQNWCLNPYIPPPSDWGDLTTRCQSRITSPPR